MFIDLVFGTFPFLFRDYVVCSLVNLGKNLQLTPPQKQAAVILSPEQTLRDLGSKIQLRFKQWAGIKTQFFVHLKNEF